MTTKEAAEWCRCSVDTIVRAVGRGELRCSRRGGRGARMFRRAWLDRWL